MIIVQALILLGVDILGSYLIQKKRFAVSFIDIAVVILISLFNNGRYFISGWMIAMILVPLLCMNRKSVPLRELIVRLLYFYSLCYLSFYIFMHISEMIVLHNAFLILSRDIVVFQGVFGIFCLLLMGLIILLQEQVPPPLQDTIKAIVILLAFTCFLQGLAMRHVRLRVVFVIVSLLAVIICTIMIRIHLVYQNERHVSDQYRDLLETQRVYNETLIQNRTDLERYQHHMLESMTSLYGLLSSAQYHDVMRRLEADIAFMKENRALFQTQYLLIDGILESKKKIYQERKRDLRIERLALDLKDIKESDVALMLYLMLSDELPWEASFCRLFCRKNMLLLDFSFEGKRLLPERMEVLSHQIKQIIAPYQGFLTCDLHLCHWDVCIVVPSIKNT